MSDTISHAFVLPDKNFHEWFQALQDYRATFDRVAVIRDPGGNDLNPYRNVTAVAAPKVWLQDDPLLHIRRIYPQVVRVDVVQAQTPAELTTILEQRIKADDRYGETLNHDDHLHDRFVLAFPTTHQPMQILATFTPVDEATGGAEDNIGIHIASRAGAQVIASAAGEVTRTWAGQGAGDLGIGNYVQVTTQYDIHPFVVTYGNLDAVSLPPGRMVSVGDKLGTAQGDRFLLMVQAPESGSAHRIPNVIDPLPLIYINNFRVQPTVAKLNVRSIASTDGDRVGSVTPSDRLISKEPHGRVLAKLGQADKWLRIRLPNGEEGHAAAWFLQATQYKRLQITVNPVGVNLDARHALGTPPPDQLGDMGWVRFGYNVNAGRQSTDADTAAQIKEAYELYAPLCEQYAKAGYKVIMTTSHQTYGEGKDQYWPWGNLQEADWFDLAIKFADVMDAITRQYAGKGLIHAWQLWNEQDAETGAEASVAMTPEIYGGFCSRVEPSIRANDNEVLVLTGGLKSGPDTGTAYIRTAMNHLAAGVTFDGIAFHPYGRGANHMRYAIYGKLDESIAKYSAVLPGKPLWITEWGVLNANQESPADIAAYALDVIKHVKTNHSETVASLVWYAWAESMHNGYGIVDRQSRPRPPLTEQFLKA
jgi:hypothetical protein